MCDENKNNNNSIFIIGLIFGAIIAGVIVLTSAQDKAKVVKKIKSKFNDLFGEKVEEPKKIIKKIVKKSSNIRRDVPPLRDVSTMIEKPIEKPIIEQVKKIAVDIPSNVETLNLTPVKEPKPKMVFKKSKI